MPPNAGLIAFQIYENQPVTAILTLQVQSPQGAQEQR